MLSNVNLYISSYISNTTAWNMASKPKQKLSSYVSKPHERKEAAIVLCHLSWKYTLKNRTKVWGTCTHVILQIWDFFICFCDCFFLGHSSMLVFDFLDVSASLVGGSWICWKNIDQLLQLGHYHYILSHLSWFCLFFAWKYTWKKELSKTISKPLLAVILISIFI